MAKKRCEIHKTFLFKNGSCGKCREEIVALVNASKHLTRNETPLMILAYQAEGLLAKHYDKIVSAPKERIDNIKPITDKFNKIVAELAELNTIIENAMTLVLTKEKYDSLIVKSIRIMDIASGKVKNCETCITAIEHDKTIKEFIKKEWVEK